jgi:hypothetical protein
MTEGEEWGRFEKKTLPAFPLGLGFGGFKKWFQQSNRDFLKRLKRGQFGNNSVT